MKKNLEKWRTKIEKSRAIIILLWKTDFRVYNLTDFAVSFQTFPELSADS